MKHYGVGKITGSLPSVLIGPTSHRRSLHGAAEEAAEPHTGPRPAVRGCRLGVVPRAGVSPVDRVVLSLRL